MLQKVEKVRIFCDWHCHTIRDSLLQKVEKVRIFWDRHSHTIRELERYSDNLEDSLLQKLRK